MFDLQPLGAQRALVVDATPWALVPSAELCPIFPPSIVTVAVTPWFEIPRPCPARSPLR